MKTKNIKIFDTTLRDGEQSPGFSMNLNEKLAMSKRLEELNVDVIEAGFPIASEGDFESVMEIAKVVENAEVAGLCRTAKKDIDRAWEALQHAKNPRIHTFIATSDLHLKYKLNKSREEVLDLVYKYVKYASRYCANVEFSAEDGSRSDREYLVEIFSAAVEAGANVLNVPDTVGYANPWEYGELIKYLKTNIRNIDKAIISVHCHNDLGMAVSNSLAGIMNGAEQVECTINGIGERAGNASLEEVQMAIQTRESYFKCHTNVKSDKIYQASKTLAEITGVQVQPNKAIVGENAFAHEAGIHQDGVIKNPLTYEIMTPQSVGLKTNKLVIGKHSGRHAIKKTMDDLGIKFKEKDINNLYIKVIKCAEEKKCVEEKDLIEIAEDYFEFGMNTTTNEIQKNKANGSSNRKKGTNGYGRFKGSGKNIAKISSKDDNKFTMDNPVFNDNLVR